MTTEIEPAPPAAGDPAPDFELPDDTGASRRLTEMRGRWLVLYFYPKDDTPGCTREACSFRDANDAFAAHDAEIWGVSVLGSGSKAAFKEKFRLRFTLLADEDHAVAERYGSWVQKESHGKTYWGVARTTFLIDPEGRIRRVWRKVSPDAHAEEILAALDDARRDDS